jgi:NarL family two-component system response regulator LiaR
MPNLNGLEATGRLRAMDQPPEVIILSQYSRTDYVVEALLAGARGYLLKDAVADELVRAIQTVYGGQRYLSAQLPQDEIDAYVQRREQMPSPLGRLTAREREVLQMVAEGNTNRQIARRLGISVKTVEKHRFNLMEKLDIRDVTALVRFAMMHGVISDEP